MIPRIVRSCLSAGSLAFASTLFAQAQTRPTVYPQAPGAPINLARPPPDAAEETVDFRLHGGDIDAVLDALETYTGRTIIHPGSLPVIPGGFTIDLTHVPKSEAVLALETLLTLNNLAVSPMGDHFLKVVPLINARSEAPEYIEGSTLGLPVSNKIATKLFQLKFLRANELFGTTLASMFNQQIGGGVVILEKANSALVTDTVANLQRLETLIKAVDQPNEGVPPIFFPLHHAKASDLVTKVRALLNGPVQTRFSTTTVYTADDRTNQVVVLCDPRERPFFNDLIAKLDVDSASNVRTEVIYLKHATAKDLGTTLSNLITGQQSAAQKLASQSAVRPGESAAPMNAQGVPSAPGSAAALNAAEASGTAEFSSLMTVIPDDRSNSIVVSGTVDDIRLMHELIDKLDAPLPQVRIEVIIAEVQLSDTDQSGITALGLTVGQSSTGATHILNWAGSGTSTNPTTGAATGTTGTSIAGWDFTNGIVNPLAFNAAMNATSAGGKSLTKVISSQVIVTAHGKKAEAISGEQIPISSSTTSTPVSGTVSGFATTGTTSYQTIAIDLTVTPLVGDNGDVQLTIDQKVNDVDGYETLNGNQTPIIANREANSYVTVKDGQMIVLGGLQKTTKTTQQNKIGFLFEIPIISQLLGGHTDDLERTELLFFIRPHIIPPDTSTPDTVQSINGMSNKKQIDDFLKNPTPQTESKTQNLIDRFKQD
ncbi:MAG: secretin N-terminal domain-containing protein [Opitutaceae bacterium]|jgi:general secretion pathway protein D